MTIRSSLYFSYANIQSTNYGIINVNIDSGIQEEPLTSEILINEVKIRGRDKPYFQSLEKYPLQFSVSFAFEDTWDEDKIREVTRWLCNQNYYQPLFFSDNITRIYYALVVESPTLVHNCLQQGYINITFRCDSAYTYSSIYTSSLYDFSLSSPNTIEFTNNGDIDLKPEISILKYGNGDISIFNQSNGNKEFKFTGLTDQEELYVDCDREYIESNINGVYRYANFNDQYLSLLRGVNVLNVVGQCKIQFRYQFKTLQG